MTTAALPRPGLPPLDPRLRRGGITLLVALALFAAWWLIPREERLVQRPAPVEEMVVIDLPPPPKLPEPEPIPEDKPVPQDTPVEEQAVETPPEPVAQTPEPPGPPAPDAAVDTRDSAAGPVGVVSDASGPGDLLGYKSGGGIGRGGGGGGGGGEAGYQGFVRAEIVAFLKRRPELATAEFTVRMRFRVTGDRRFEIVAIEDITPAKFATTVRRALGDFTRVSRPPPASLLGKAVLVAVTQKDLA